MINDSQEKTKKKNKALNLRENVKVSIQMACFETGMTKETILKQSTDGNLEENNLPYKFSKVRRLTSFLNNDGAVLEIFSDDFRRGEDSKTGLKWIKYNLF